MDDEVYEEYVDAPPSQRWHWSFLAMRALSFGSSVAHSAGVFCHTVAMDLAAHANHQIERDVFAADAGRELEMILNGPEED